MTKTWVLVPLANDAVKNVQMRQYLDIGPHAKERITQAVRWASERTARDDYLWVFGAGTDKDFRFGLTLAQRAEIYLRKLLPSTVKVVANHADKHYYGTYEEMKWSVKAVSKRYHPGEFVFVFFGPRWHLWRARLIWALFFKREWGRARFEVTTDGAKPNWRHELCGYGKIVGHRLFPHWIKTRDQTPYPPTVQRFGIGC